MDERNSIRVTPADIDLASLRTENERLEAEVRRLTEIGHLIQRDRDTWHQRWQQLMRDHEEVVRERDDFLATGHADEDCIRSTVTAERDRLATALKEAADEVNGFMDSLDEHVTHDDVYSGLRELWQALRTATRGENDE